MGRTGAGRLTDRAVPVLLGVAVLGLSIWAAAPPPILGKTDHGPTILPALAGAVSAALARRRRWPLYLTDLDRLLEQSRAAGIPIIRHDHGQARPLPTATQRAAYRVVQEALTNVGKHAGDADTTVILRYLRDTVQVTVRNSAPARPVTAGVAGSGLGLAGLRERVELLGGQFTADHDHGGGFTMRATLPAEEPA